MGPKGVETSMSAATKLRDGKLLTVLLLSFFIISLLQVSPQFASNSTNPSSAGYSEQGNIISDLSSPFDPSGPPRPVIEFAIGTRSGQTVGLPSSPNAYVDLDTDWIGNAARITISNFWDSRNHAVNGTFDSGSGTSSPPWSFSKYDPLSHGTFTGAWIQNSPQSGNKTVYCQMPLPAGSINFNGNERVSWNETILPLRGTVLSARLVFNWWPVVASGFTRSEFIFYATVNNTRLTGVGSPFPWEFNLKDVASNSSIDNHWNLANFSIPASAFNLPSKKISIQIGIMYTSGAATYTGWNTQNIMYIDNVQLILQSYALPHNVNLKVRPSGGSNSTVSDSGGYGSGSVSLTGFTTSGTSFPFIFSGGNLTSPNAAGFGVSIILNATKQTTATSTFESHGSGEKVSWSFEFPTSFQSASQSVGAGPTIYSKYYFNVSVPSNWNYTTCRDPDGTSHNTASETGNFKVAVVGPNKILTVNVTSIGSYSRAQNSFSPYQINAESANYMKEVFTQKLVAGSWVNSTWFLIGDTMKVVGFVSSPSGEAVDSGNANMTSWWGTPASLWNSNTSNIVPVDGFANFTILIENYRGFASNYTAEVDWLNQTLSAPQAGSGTASFRVLRDLRITDLVPNNDDQFAQGRPLKLSAKIVDDLNSTPITDQSDAAPYFQVNWTGTWPAYLKWNSLGGNWTIDPSNPVNIPANAHGLYSVNVTVTGTYYTNKSYVRNIYVIYATSTQVVGGNSKTTEWGAGFYNFTMYYFGLNPPTSLAGAFVSCVSTEWVSRFVYVGPGAAGYYDCSLNMAGVNEAQDAYQIELSVFGLVGYESQTAFLNLKVNNVSTSPLDAFVPTESGEVLSTSVAVDSGGTAIFYVRYYSHGSGVLDASLTYSSDFGSGTLSPINGRPGYYQLNVTTSGITPGTYGVTVTAQKTHYETRNTQLSVLIRAPVLPVWLLVGGSVGSAAVVVGIFGGYWYIRRARIPFIIKKIDETLKLIAKGEHEEAKPVALRSREELVVGITNERIGVFSARKPTGEEAPSEAAEAVPGAPVSGAAAALKTELAAVETKEKPGEAIEEVEMDTLDAELRNLEKFENKEKLPDGAKEVRDVIEKYKEGKKKKKE
jgi:hypothetical protein